MSFISARILYSNEEFVACTKNALINSQLVNGNPRQAWIYPNGYGYYALTFSDPQKATALTGVWVTEAEQGYLLDGSLADVQTALSSCCGNTPVVVTPFYNGVFPPDPGLVAATYTVTRTDDGTISDMQDFALAYERWIIPGTIQRPTYANGVSTYTFQAYSDPAIIGNDTKTGETARVYTSNVPAVLTGSQKYSFQVIVNGDSAGAPITEAASLAAIVTAAQADANYGPLGTYSTSGGAILLTTTTQTGVASVVSITAT